MNNPCQNHGFPITHFAKDCVAYQEHVALEAQKWLGQDGYWGDYDDDGGADAAARYTMLIFGGSQAYQDRRLQKLTHRQI